MRKLCVASFGFALLLLSGCHLLTGLGDTCPSMGEYRSAACARIVVLVEGPPQPWPERYHWDVRAVPANKEAWVRSPLPAHPGPGRVTLDVLAQSATSPDTASVWVSARLLENPREIQIGVPLPVFASDSVLHVAHLTRNGVRPSTATVRLTLDRP